LYTPKNILVTGGAGFIGSHVVIRLVKNYPQYNVVNLDKLDYCSSLKNLVEIQSAPNYKLIKGDILSRDLVNYILESNCIDTILHFAAQTHVDNSFGNSIEFTKNNVLGTHVLLEASRVHPIKRFIHVSTDEVYGETIGETPSQQAINVMANTDQLYGCIESSVLEPTNPYAATKAGAEHLVKSYYKSFKLPVIITRGNNVYGPHQYPEKVIPKWINLLERDRPCCVHGDGSHRRSFLFVSDVAKAFDIILHQGKTGEIYNIGTSFELSTKDLAKILIAKYGKGEEYIQHYADRPFNDCRYAIDATKLHQLGWKSTTSFQEGLDITIEWYKKNFNNWENAELALVPGTQITPILTNSQATNKPKHSF
jgi:dTDP-glucose 4,6-dehydratase